MTSQVYNVTGTHLSDRSPAARVSPFSVNVCATGRSEAAQAAANRLMESGFDGVAVAHVIALGGSRHWNHGDTLIIDA